MRKLLLFLFVALALLGVASVVLPDSYEVSRAVVIGAPSASIHEYLGDLRRWPEWNVWLGHDRARDVRSVEAIAGRDGSLGWARREAGRVTLRVTHADPGQGLWFDLEFESDPRPTKGAILYEAVGTGTRVTWIQRGDLGPSPVARIRGLFSDGLLGPDVEANLSGLARRLGGG